ncbi:MAG TPA: hypothetical protein TECP_01134 [Hyphomicrobiaceae bacterium MAG_BT-2024]
MNAPNCQCQTPEQLVGFGFRGWLAGYEYQSVAFWEMVWHAYVAALGSTHAKLAVSDLSSWIRTIKHTTCRSIIILPTECHHFCKDECLAISIIAACQHNQCPALHSCAHALLGSFEVDVMLNEASGFAKLLAENGQYLKLSSSCNVNNDDNCRYSTLTHH